MRLIVGLGNPGKQYERTRHNVGFLLVKALFVDLDENPEWKNESHLRSFTAKGTINNKRVLLALPQTYMNNSGEAVQTLLSFYKLKPNNLIVVHDDKDIPLGEIRVHKGRGAAGHNGVLSVIEHVGTKDFTRIRVGVAPATKDAMNRVSTAMIGDTANFVLGKFGKEEQKVLKEVIKHVVKEIKRLV